MPNDLDANRGNRRDPKSGERRAPATPVKVAGCFIIVPIYNEQRNIERFITQLDAIVSNLPAIGRVLFVDDGSSDETPSLIERNLPRSGWHVLRNPRNRGKGAAMRVGLAYAAYHGAHAVIFMDGDCQHDPAHLGEFLTSLETSSVVFGYRLLSKDAPWLRRSGNRVATSMIRYLFGIRRRDLLCGFMAFRRDAFPALNWTSDGYGVEAELATIVARRRMSFAEVNVPVIYLDRGKGVHLGHALRILACVPQWYFRRTRLPKTGSQLPSDATPRESPDSRQVHRPARRA